MSTRILEKTERRLGEKLLLKGDRCVGPKCATVRRPYPPGARSKKRRRGQSEYGQLLQEKQKVRFLYGLDDRDIERYSEKATAATGVFATNFLRLLENRLDNTVYRVGFAASRRIARQLVSHGHILVNGRRVTVPSYRVRKDDVVAVRPESSASPFFAELDIRLKKYEPPRWLSLNREKREGRVLAPPEAEDAQLNIDVTKIKEFYSR